MKKSSIVFIAVAITCAAGTVAQATIDCDFLKDNIAQTWVLLGDGTTDETIFIPDGYLLDGNGYIITAIDPPGGHFVGAVVANGGAEAYVINLGVTADGLANTCDGGANRLRGIMLEGASGCIAHCQVIGINQGPSGCQEGNGIEVRNEPFDGTHPNTKTVEIAHCLIDSYQKTGIVANGDVDVYIHHNYVGESATQENLAANSIQIGFGGIGVVEHNTIWGNQWMGTSPWVATAILIIGAEVEVSKNNIRGNSDVGIYAYADGGTYDNNRIFDIGADHVNSSDDYGFINYGDNAVTNNKVRGFDNPYYGVDIEKKKGNNKGRNKVIPGPHASE